MNKLVFILFVLSFALFCGCATTILPTMKIQPKVEIIDIPPLNEEAKAELGNTVLIKSEINTHYAIELINSISTGDGTWSKKWTLDPGLLVAKEYNENWIYYHAEHDALRVYDSLLGEERFDGGLLLPRSKENREKPRIFINPSLASREVSSRPQYKPKKIQNINEPVLRQELIYNGRVSNSIKFIYREFVDGMARPSFTQDLQYDLNEGYVIGFKGARIKIVEATNVLISYIVLNSFPNQ